MLLNQNNRTVAADVDVGKSTINQIKKGKYYPYKVHHIQELIENNVDSRLQFYTCTGPVLVMKQLFSWISQWINIIVVRGES